MGDYYREANWTNNRAKLDSTPSHDLRGTGRNYGRDQPNPAPLEPG